MTSTSPPIYRWKTREVHIGNIRVGADNPIRVQSMTTTDTKDVGATVQQSLRLAEAGCEIVRITAPNLRAAQALQDIRKELLHHKCDVPLVADIHFLPQAAMEAVEHVEKVRVNPGNYADRKKFQIREYTDAQYNEELERLHEAFSPLVLRCKELGRTLRIGTNHGSLSDRILNRYGDTPKGMVESALEFIRIAQSHGFHEIILSMKASNPKVMIQAYRLAAQEMMQAGMNYPLHLGVTEAGDGEDGRIKSTIGIGSLLMDGLGDTIRVSLTEDPINEIPVAQQLAKLAQNLWAKRAPVKPELFPQHQKAQINPFAYTRHPTETLTLSEEVSLGGEYPPRVVVPIELPLSRTQETVNLVAQIQSNNKEAPIEALLLTLQEEKELQPLDTLRETLAGAVPALVLDDPNGLIDKITPNNALTASPTLIIHKDIPPGDKDCLLTHLQAAKSQGFHASIGISAEDLNNDAGSILATGTTPIITLTNTSPGIHPISEYRELFTAIQQGHLLSPIWIRNTDQDRYQKDLSDPTSKLIDAALLTGAVMCDGFGNVISVETAATADQARHQAYNILQGVRSRNFKTEFVACPSCGRTLFDLETTTQKVREHTGHLSGVTIAVMGCIVNGPGEMADADFGYVGGAPGKINLYVGKDCVQTSIPEAEAVDRLIDLIKEHDLWQEPQPTPLTL
jgi:(E)-4-hydroxy-3-methylbut-2-enyl-diphosphate synthase